MVLPLPPVAPVIPPVIVPTVHVKELATLAFNAILVDVLLQIDALDGTPVTTGVGLTVTTIEYVDAAGQFPVLDVGVTRYSTVPAVVLLGFVNI